MFLYCFSEPSIIWSSRKASIKSEADFFDLFPDSAFRELLLDFLIFESYEMECSSVFPLVKKDLTKKTCLVTVML